MTLSTILQILLPLLFGSGITALVTLKPARKKAFEEAEKTKRENTDVTVETLKKGIKLLQEQLDKTLEIIKEKSTQLEQKNAKIEELTQRIQALYDDMCVHKGCKLRKPHHGQGQKWYDQHTDDDSLGCDYLSVEWLLKMWRRNQKEDNSENTSEE